MLVTVLYLYVLVNTLAFVYTLFWVDGADKRVDEICNELAEYYGLSSTLTFVLYMLMCSMVFVPVAVYCVAKKW